MRENNSTPRERSFDEMTKTERVNLILNDSDKYIDLVPPGHWLQVLDGIASLGSYEPD